MKFIQFFREIGIYIRYSFSVIYNFNALLTPSFSWFYQNKTLHSNSYYGVVEHNVFC